MTAKPQPGKDIPLESAAELEFASKEFRERIDVAVDAAIAQGNEVARVPYFCFGSSFSGDSPPSAAKTAAFEALRNDLKEKSFIEVSAGYGVYGIREHNFPDISIYLTRRAYEQSLKPLFSRVAARMTPQDSAPDYSELDPAIVQRARDKVEATARATFLSNGFKNQLQDAIYHAIASQKEVAYIPYSFRDDALDSGFTGTDTEAFETLKADLEKSFPGVATGSNEYGMGPYTTWSRDIRVFLTERAFEQSQQPLIRRVANALTKPKTPPDYSRVAPEILDRVKARLESDAGKRFFSSGFSSDLQKAFDDARKNGRATATVPVWPERAEMPGIERTDTFELVKQRLQRDYGDVAVVPEGWLSTPKLQITLRSQGAAPAASGAKPQTLDP